MIAVHIMGGLGNQLFQYATARCLAYKNKTTLKFETSECNSQDVAGSHFRYRLNNFNIEENFITLDEALKLERVVEKDHKVFYPEILSLKDNIFLHGYWGHEEYFKEVENILREELTPKNHLGKISKKWKEKILSAECPVSIHVRHGDYLNPLIRHESGILPMQYYEDCVAELKKNFNLTVFIFSDDLQWMKNNFRLEAPTEFVEGCESDIDELFLMSYCKHNIIANSTFSWWGGVAQ